MSPETATAKPKESIRRQDPRENGESQPSEGRDETLRRQLKQQLESLQSEFADISPDRVRAYSEAEFDHLRAGARITEFIPLLVHRYAREDLLRLRQNERRAAA